jgi:hypothetical protein
MLREGQKVAYTGYATSELNLGDEGRILLMSSNTAHISFENGISAGQIVPVALHDLSPLQSTSSIDTDLNDSLETSGLTAFAVRDVYDMGGETAILNAMHESGHLAAFQDIAEDALILVASLIRRDPSFIEVLSQLDEEEADSVVRTAASVLIRDAFYED